MTSRKETVLLTLGLMAAIAALVLRLNPLQTEPGREFPHAEIVATEKEGSEGGVAFTVYLSPTCDGCAQVWSAILRHKDKVPNGVPKVSALVVPWDKEEAQLAMAIECAAIEGRLWDFAVAVLRMGGKTPIGILAGEAGLRNIPDHADCVSQKRMGYELDSRLSQLRSWGVTGVPHILVNSGREVSVISPERFVERLNALFGNVPRDSKPMGDNPPGMRGDQT